MGTFILDLEKSVSEALRNRGFMLVTAESCTGGLIAKKITDLAGSSSILERGYVTYSNQSKIDLLDVPETILKEHGAVSPETAQNMAKGALKNSQAQIAVSVTGIAGPGGGTDDKPVGLVYIGYAKDGQEAIAHEFHFHGSRADIREQTSRAALSLILEQLGAA